MSGIKKGDLVMVVNDCCLHLDDGTIGIVAEVEITFGEGSFECEECGFKADGELSRIPHISTVPTDNDIGWVPSRWLKRIDPHAEGDSLPTRADLEITA